MQVARVGHVGRIVAFAFPVTVAALARGVEPLVEVTGVERIAERQPEVFLGGIDQDTFLQQQQQLAAWLTTELPVAVLDTPISVRITDNEARELIDAPLTGESPLKVGFVKPLENVINFAGLGRAGKLAKERREFAGGILTPTQDGGYVWAASFTSENAGGLRLHLENLVLPPSAEVYFYSPSGEAYGPFDHTNINANADFWTPSVMGSTGVLQVRINGPINANDLRNLSFQVTEVGHIGPAFFGIQGVGTVASFCQYNASCIENTNCVNEAAVNNAELAVAKMFWVAGCCIYTCSGGLIADNDPAQGNYFLTANHCLSRNRDAQSLEAFFRYQVSCGTSTCTGTFTDPPTNLIAGKTLGATVQATGSAGDFTLLQLSQNPPSGSVFLGWNNSPVAFTNGAVLHRVSHPSGAPQAYSRQHVDTGAPTCQGWPRGDRIYSRDEIGGTEGGSSGSPVVNASGQIVGQLTGACGFNVGDVCDDQSNATVDGAFAFYFSSVEPFLDPGTGCTPSTEVCDDGNDNDCDGATDCADSDCSGDPACSGGCSPSGASCTDNSECCSNNCKGRPGNKTCK